jgi:hypothetical protein
MLFKLKKIYVVILLTYSTLQILAEFTYVSPTGFQDQSPNFRLPIYQPYGLKNKLANNIKARRADMSVKQIDKYR